MSTSSSSSTQTDRSGSWSETVEDIYNGSIVGAAHNFFFFKKWVHDTLMGGSGHGQEDQDQQLPVGSLKVLGAGFGRTGTYSLTLALDELGFPTLHTRHLYENEGILRMWSDKIFQPSLENGHAELGTPDFDVITRHGYVGTTDLPMALYFEQVYEKYPDCKFILTTRENSEVWFRSWDTLTRSITGPTNFGGKFISDVHHYSVYLRWLFALVNKDDTFLTSDEPKMIQDKEAAIETYESHNARVRELIPPSQLLEYNVKQGWEPLCEFLEVAPAQCPTDRAFPKTNSARAVRYQAASAAATPLICVLFCLFYLFTVAFKRMTGQSVVQWVQNQAQRQIPHFLRKVLLGQSSKKGGGKKHSPTKSALLPTDSVYHPQKEC